MHRSSLQIDVNGAESSVAVSTAGSARKVRKKTRSTSKSSGKLFSNSRRTNSLLGVQVVSCGAYVPQKVVTNEDLEKRYGFDPGWIEQRTGILERRHAAPDQATSDLCVKAARKAIRAARIDSQDIDLVVVGTFTPDYISCPSTACLVQSQLDLDAPAVDLHAACSGFIYAMVTAAQYVATGNSKLALVIGGDTNSRIVNPHDQRIAPLFGDGAGAVLLARGDPHQGLICYQMGSDGSGGSLLSRPVGGTRNPATVEDIAAGRHFLQMDGRSVFKWAVRTLIDTIDLVLEKMPVSISLGLWTTLIVYLISIPLGIRKAVHDGTPFDVWTSGFIIVGYAIPGFLFALLLVVMFAGGSFLDWFPLRGLTSENWDELSAMGKVFDYLWHLVLPVVAMVIGGFAGLTMLTKNSFLEEINKQYVITARAKGLAERRVLYGHIFRNAMLIVIAGFPSAFISILFTGSVLIEIIFSLDGLGLLGFEAAFARDYPVMFGTLFFFSLLGLVMGLIGDLMYTVIDPRITFERVGA